jgi:hypothetical protein
VGVAGAGGSQRDAADWDGAEPQAIIDTMCRMFAGPALVHDFRRLSQLGPGVLSIDLIPGTCRHGRRHIPRLAMVDRLRDWLRRNCSTDARKVVLTVSFDLDQHGEQRDHRTHWAGEHASFVGCTMTIRGEMQVGNEVAKAEHKCVLEWPSDF